MFQTNNQKQAECKSWLDKIVQPTALSRRVIPRLGQTVITPEPTQFTRFRAAVDAIEAGKFATAAHALRAWRAHNPWL
jgi:hypothetical protein